MQFSIFSTPAILSALMLSAAAIPNPEAQSINPASLNKRILDLSDNEKNFALAVIACKTANTNDWGIAWGFCIENAVKEWKTDGNDCIKKAESNINLIDTLAHKCAFYTSGDSQDECFKDAYKDYC